MKPHENLQRVFPLLVRRPSAISPIRRSRKIVFSEAGEATVDTLVMDRAASVSAKQFTDGLKAAPLAVIALNDMSTSASKYRACSLLVDVCAVDCSPDSPLPTVT